MTHSSFEKSSFWTTLRHLTFNDNSVDVSDQAVSRAKSIFQPTKPVYFLTLQPAWSGAVRKGIAHGKYLYQTEEGFMVELETNSDNQSWQLCGSLLDSETPCNITLFGIDTLQEQSHVDHRFQFGDLAPGPYRICFEQEGVTFWIKSLDIGTNQQTPGPV